MKIYAEAEAAAQKRPAFSNGFEWDCWSAAWCNECVHEDDCPLILVAMLGKTPVEWTEDEPLGLETRYVCQEFEQLAKSPAE